MKRSKKLERLRLFLKGGGEDTSAAQPIDEPVVNVENESPDVRPINEFGRSKRGRLAFPRQFQN